GPRRGDAGLEPAEDVHPAGAAVLEVVQLRPQAWSQVLLHRDRHPDLRREAELDAVEALLTDSDHREAVPVDRESLAQNPRIGAEAVHPKVVAQNRLGMPARDAVVVRGDG